MSYLTRLVGYAQQLSDDRKEPVFVVVDDTTGDMFVTNSVNVGRVLHTAEPGHKEEVSIDAWL